MPLDTQRSPWVGVAADAALVDTGLRSYMLRVYNYMASGLALTGLVAAMIASSPEIMSLFFSRTGITGLGWLAVLSPILLVFGLSYGIARMQASTAQLLFWVYAALNGIAFSSIFLVYTGTSITRVFFITAASFLSLSIYGYATKRDLSAFGGFLIMGLFGLIIASLVNMFLHSSALQFITSVAGVLIFAGLTAFDTQKIKEIYLEDDGEQATSKKAVMGALTLYLDFINMFLMLLRLFGDRRE